MRKILIEKLTNKTKVTFKNGTEIVRSVLIGDAVVTGDSKNNSITIRKDGVSPLDEPIRFNYNDLEDDFLTTDVDSFITYLGNNGFFV